MKDTSPYKEVIDKNPEKYSKYYSESSFKNKISYIAARGGSTVIYAALLLYSVMKDENVPFKTKAIVVGALGYLILPIDIIPDIAPILGLSDDLGVLLYAIKQVGAHVTPAMRGAALEKIAIFFPSLSEADLSKLEENIF